jgi:hypothetical protein
VRKSKKLEGEMLHRLDTIFREIIALGSDAEILRLYQKKVKEKLPVLRCIIIYYKIQPILTEN